MEVMMRDIFFTKTVPGFAVQGLCPEECFCEVLPHESGTPVTLDLVDVDHLIKAPTDDEWDGDTEDYGENIDENDWWDRLLDLGGEG